MSRTLLATLRLPYESLRTLYEGTSEVRLYRNDITGVQQIGKRVSALGNEEAAVFREAKILSNLRHDHIVPVSDVAVVDDPQIDRQLKVIEMIIPYYQHGSAYDALERGERFSIGAAVQLTREVLNGLNELHEGHRLLHRDIKSANVFLDDNRRMRVGDLGLAIPMNDDGTAETYPTCQMYSAPESASAEHCERSTDIYGVGLLLFELLNGPFPYSEYNRGLIDQRLQKGQRPLLDRHLAFKPCVPSRLRQVVNKAISRDPSRRYANTREMMDALDRAPFIDWSASSASADSAVWEGAVGGSADRRSYRVSAEKCRRGSGWRLSGLHRVNRWQRCVTDQTVADLAGREAQSFFDDLVKLATSD